jgi:sugar phosphate isomerase/epimerase
MNRRQLLQAGASAVALIPSSAALAAQGESKKPADRWHGLKIGVATYTLRQLPLETAIKDIQRVGLHYCSIKDVHLPFKTSADERKAVAQKFKDAGITPLSCGNVGMKNDEANIRTAFEYARDIGLPTIVCAPPPEALPILDKLVKEFDIRIAIHNHGPEDKQFPSPYDVWKAVQPFDKRVGLCIDVGHSARAGAEPAEAILKCRERLYDVHLKDISNTTPKGANVECGRGVLDLKGICRNLLKINFEHHVGFEYEKDGSDPLPGLAESVGYVHGILAMIG